MITVVDHRDSFTRNLEHLLSPFDEVKVIDRLSISPSEIQESNILVLSPGPGKPDDYPESKAIYQKAKGKIPILGVCLGFQLIMEQEGCEIIRQKQVLHGVESEIFADKNSATYRNLEEPIKVGRYHSLQINPDSICNLPEGLKVTAHDPIRNIPLSFEDLDRKLFGLQYHPESFLSNQGTKIISDILHARMEQRWHALRSS
mgnify:CR=1 FL=1